jgi:hypothetical protein
VVQLAMRTDVHQRELCLRGVAAPSCRARQFSGCVIDCQLKLSLLL